MFNIYVYFSIHRFLYRQGFKYILGIVALGLMFWILLNFARKKYFWTLFSLSWNPKRSIVFKKSLMLLHLLSTSATYRVPLWFKNDINKDYYSKKSVYSIYPILRTRLASFKKSCMLEPMRDKQNTTWKKALSVAWSNSIIHK